MLNIDQPLFVTVPGQLLETHIFEYQQGTKTKWETGETTMLQLLESHIFEYQQGMKTNWETGETTMLQLLLAIGWQIAIWKGKLKAKHCLLRDYSYWPEFFNILAICKMLLSFYLLSVFKIRRVINFVMQIYI